MKTLKTFVLVSLLTLGLTQSVFAAWWNPFTWHFGWFKRDVQVTQPQVISETQTPSTVVTSDRVKAQDPIVGRACTGKFRNEQGGCPNGYDCKLPTNASLGEYGTCVKASSSVESFIDSKSFVLLSPNISADGNQILQPGKVDIKWKANNFGDNFISFAVVKVTNGQLLVGSPVVKASLGMYTITIPEVSGIKGEQPKYVIVVSDAEDKVIATSSRFTIGCSSCAPEGH